MTRENYERVEALFDAVVSLEPPQQRSYLDEHCDDPDVRRHVEAMLAVDAETNPALATPAMRARQSDAARAALGEDALPETIERYRIVRLLGSGGMGVVYEAEQDQPRRRVALKVMRPGVLSREMIQRFEIEAHVLGQLHHPGIAQIYESGLADGGDGAQPYFAMELIEGCSLKEFVRVRDCSIRDRLELVVSIAEAVQHAHQKGVIHRDLKPDNVLIDEDARPKVLDFGVARATNADVQMTTLHTNAGQIIGTLAYMSPEQVAARPDELDTRSDVYSLGVMTYELLTGALPVDVTQQSVPNAMRMIQETEPRRLSDLNTRLRGDLETIVGKAMEKEKSRRYQTAAEFAADIQRYLNDEPIIARRASTLYQWRKFAKRNKALVSGVVGIMLALLLGMGVATRFALDAAEQRVEAEAARDVARRDSQRLRAVNEFVLGMLAEANPTVNPLNREMTVADMLDAAAARIDTSFDDAPDIKAEIYATIGNAYGELARFDRALAFLTTALETSIELHGPRHENVATAMHALGTARQNAGDLEGPRICSKTRSPSDERSSESATAIRSSRLPRFRFSTGDYNEAEKLLQDAIAIGHEVMPDDHVTLASIHAAMGTLAWQRGEQANAQERFRAAVDLYRAANDDLHPHYVQWLTSLAVVLRWRGELDAAEAMYDEALEKARRAYGEEHTIVATLLNNIGWLHQSRGNLHVAEPFVRQAMEMRRRLYGPEHPDVSELMHNLAALLADMENLEEAVPLMREALEIRRRSLGPDHADIVPALHTMAELLVAAVQAGGGDLDEPEQLLREAVQIDSTAYGPDHPHVAASLQLLAELLHTRQELAEAEATLRRAVEIRHAAFGPANSDTARTNLQLAQWLLEQERLAEAEPLLMVLYEHLPEAAAAARHRVAAKLARLYEASGRMDDARTWSARAASDQ